MSEIVKTIMLMGILIGLFMFCGYLLGGAQGMLIAFCIAMATNFFSYFFSDTMVLKHFNAVEVSQNDAKGLHDIVKRLTQKANLPMPKVYIINENTPNAFATGRDPSHAAVAVNTGLLDLMTPQEVEAVLAHEMSHVRHYDILIGSVAAVFAGAIAMIANFAKFSAIGGGEKRPNPIVLIFAIIVMPLAAAVIQMAISRNREFMADEGSARLTGHPEWLISALSKLQNYSQNSAMANASPQNAHMFIINPLGSLGGTLSTLFKTHPSTEKRIQRLKSLRV